MKRRPPRSNRTDTPFPSTTPCRSRGPGNRERQPARRGRLGVGPKRRTDKEQQPEQPRRSGRQCRAAGSGKAAKQRQEEVGADQRRSGEIGRAACRERECRYGSISVVAVSLKTTKNQIKQQQP